MVISTRRLFYEERESQFRVRVRVRVSVRVREREQKWIATGVSLVLSVSSEVVSCLYRNIHLVLVQRYVAMQARRNFTGHSQDKIDTDRDWRQTP